MARSVARRWFGWSVLLAMSMVMAAARAEAHVAYNDLDAPPVLVTTKFDGTAIADPCQGMTSGCQSSNAFTRFGWINGTLPALGDSHFLTVNAEFWKFHLDRDSTVTINFTQAQAGLDPAFSVYRGLLPLAGHDDVLVDPLNPTSGGCSVDSPKDAHAAPYTYQVHDGYRDTLSYSTTGGLTGCLPVNPYIGQFDAFASFSMANTAGDWARISYLASVGATAFNGHDGGTNTAGNHNSAIGTGETLTLTLPGGFDYTIAAGGEACVATLSGGAYGPPSCASPRLYGTISITKASVTPVPAVTPWGIAVLVAGLLAFGVFTLPRRRRDGPLAGTPRRARWISR